MAQLFAVPDGIVRAADLGSPPASSHHTFYYRDGKNQVWIGKELDRLALVGEAVAVVLSQAFEVRLADGAADTSNLTWYSRRLALPTWTEASASRVALAPLARLVAFDVVVAMGDRHDGNLLLEPAGRLLTPIGIDHESAAVCWGGNPDMPTHAITGGVLGSQEFRDLLRVRAAEIAAFDAKKCDLEDAAGVLNSQERDDLEERLLLRCESAEELVQQWLVGHGYGEVAL